MSELEEKLGSILSNPQMMQQIMGLANSLSAGQSEPQTNSQSNNQSNPQVKSEAPASPLPAMDPNMLQSIMKFANQGGIDQNQLSLLKALQPYLSRDRITRLERAMHAARMANAASAFLNSGGLKMLTGR